MNREPQIALVSTNKYKYSETFIQSHLHGIKGTVHFLFDGYLPGQYSTDKGVTCANIKQYGETFFSSLFNKSKSSRTQHEKKLELYLKKNKIDMVFCEYGPSGAEMAPLAKKLNIPLIVHFHGYDAYRSDILISYGKNYKALFENSAAIVAVSKHMMDHLQALGCSREKLHFIPYGINLTLFRKNESVQKDITFVACGRFVEKKAPTQTIRAFAKVLSRLPGASLVMIGDGDLKPYCEILAAKLGLKHAIEFKGALSQPEIAQLFNRAQVFVQHSITTPQNDSEGTPLALLESAACGLPAVSTRHGGISDVVIENQTGFLVNENDTEAMAAYMLLLAKDTALASAMGNAARQRISDNYSQKQRLAELQKLIDANLKNHD